MDSVVYDRQKKLNLRIPHTVSIVGCGGVGAWVGIDFALSGVQKIYLFDNDNLEYHNLNRLPYTSSDVGKKKVEVLKTFIAERRPDTAVRCFGNVTDITKKMLAGVVVDCTDKLAAQKVIYDECTKSGMPYYRVGYDGNHISVFDGRHPNSPKPTKVWDDGSGRDGYTIVSSWAAPPQLIASLVTYIVCGSRRPVPPISGKIGDVIDGASEYLQALGQRS